MTQVFYQIFTYKEQADIPPSVVKWFVDYVHVNLYYLHLFTPLELLSCSKVYQPIIPKYDTGLENFQQITPLDLEETKIIISKTIHDILLAAEMDDLEDEENLSYMDKLKKDWDTTGTFAEKAGAMSLHRDLHQR